MVLAEVKPQFAETLIQFPSFDSVVLSFAVGGIFLFAFFCALASFCLVLGFFPQIHAVSSISCLNLAP